MWADRHGFQYLGVDYAYAPLNRGLIQADGVLLPFPDNSMDAVCALGSLEHFDDPRSGMREMYRVCKSGGLAVISVPNKPIIENLGLYHGTEQPQELRLTFNKWKYFIEAAGFRVVSWHKDYGGKVFKNRKPIKVLQRLLLKLTVCLPKCFAYQWIFNCKKI